MAEPGTRVWRGDGCLALREQQSRRSGAGHGCLQPHPCALLRVCWLEGEGGKEINAREHTHTTETPVSVWLLLSGK